MRRVGCRRTASGVWMDLRIAQKPLRRAIRKSGCAGRWTVRTPRIERGCGRPCKTRAKTAVVMQILTAPTIAGLVGAIVDVRVFCDIS